MNKRDSARVRSGPYQTAAWQRKRAAQLSAEPLCRFCAQKGRVSLARVADHVVPHRGDADLFWHGELQSLCFNCHNSAKRLIELQQDPKFRPDGTPTRASHHWNLEASAKGRGGSHLPG